MKLENLKPALTSSQTRRSFLARSAAALSVSPFAFASSDAAARTTTTSETDTVALAGAPASGQAVEGSSIRPFTVRVPQAKLDDLRRRIAATQWPEKETV